MQGAAELASGSTHGPTRPEPITLTRTALFEEVWAQPTVEIAKRYWISDVRKLNVPKPPPGYWARRQHGYRVPHPTLPPGQPGTPTATTIKPPRRGVSAAIPPEITDRGTREKAEANRITVPDRLVNPHPLVRQTTERLRQAKPDPSGRIAGPLVYVAPRTVRRALRILDTLLKAAECRGYLERGRSRLESPPVLSVLGERVRIVLEERAERIDHVFTREERERQERYGSAWATRWDYRPAGTLRLRLDADGAYGTRRAWSDGKRHRLEDLVHDVLAGMVVLADATRH